MTCVRDNEPLLLTERVAIQRRRLSPWEAIKAFWSDFLNARLDDVAPIANGNLSSAASTMAKAGAQKRALTIAEKRRVVHAQLEAFVSAKKAAAAE